MELDNSEYWPESVFVEEAGVENWIRRVLLSPPAFGERGVVVSLTGLAAPCGDAGAALAASPCVSWVKAAQKSRLKLRTGMGGGSWPRTFSTPSALLVAARVLGRLVTFGLPAVAGDVGVL